MKKVSEFRFQVSGETCLGMAQKASFPETRNLTPDTFLTPDTVR